MGNNIKISHGFFVNDVLIMGMLSRFSSLTLFHIFKKFANAIGLHMNIQKSIIYHGSSDMVTITYIKSLFDIEGKMMKNGMKYLGYHIKPCSYKIVDWQWLVDHFYKKISRWEFRCLSLGSHFSYPYYHYKLS